MGVQIILNPYANRWQGQAQAPAIENALTAAGVTCEVKRTEHASHAISLAQAAVAEGVDCLVAAGGDGTINEVLNGLLRATPDDELTIPFGIIPIGTANDFAHMQELPLDPVAAAQVVARGQTRLIDAGVVNGRYFINNAAVAMEPMVTLENIRMKRLSGEIRYLVALVKAIIKLRAWQMEIVWDGGGYEGPAYLLSVCNGPRTGGFQIAPEARFDDGLFDIVFAPELPKRTVLVVLLKLMQGKHIYHPAVTYTRTAAVTLTSRPGTPVHADGELFTEAETDVSFQILPQKVQLLVPG